MDYLADALLVGAGAGFGVASAYSRRILSRFRHEHVFGHIEGGRWTCEFCSAQKKRGS